MMADDNNTDSGNACGERLIFVTSLKDPITGDFKERLLALKFGRAEVDHVLGVEHKAVFEDWLCLNLEQQTLELDLHVSNQEAPPGEVLAEWMHEKLYQRLIPPGVMPAQRDLFMRDMETILHSLVWPGQPKRS